MKYIKVKFLRNGRPSGRAYTYAAPEYVGDGNEVVLPGGAIGVVVSADVSEEDVKSIKSEIKKIERVVGENLKN